jgi:hypothetical protein
MINKTNPIAQSKYFGRFLMKTAYLTVFLLFFACDKEEVENKSTDKFATIAMDGKLYNVESKFIGCNENCDYLYAMIQYYKNDKEYFTIEFRFTKKGAIRNIALAGYSTNSIFYETADFNPTALMKITNFEYDEAKSYLHFDFDGDLLEYSHSDELDINKGRKHIKGELTIKNVIKTSCTTAINDLTFEIPNLKFLNTLHLGGFNPKLKINPYQVEFNSDNGYRVIMKSNSDLWNLKEGTYVFTENTVENRIDFEQYIGIFRATQTSLVREIDWKKHQTSGNYTIREHVVINGVRVTKGEFNLKVFDNGVLKDNIVNAKFEIVGF